MMGEPREAAAGPSPDTPVRLVSVTVATREVGEKLARTLVEERLAACVPVVVGITSFFWWGGEVQREGEVLLVVKTQAACLDRLVSRGREPSAYAVAP